MTEPLPLEARLAQLIRQALEVLPPDCGVSSDVDVPLEIPRQTAHGDLASPIALKLASRLGCSPMELALRMVERMNERLADSSLKEALAAIEVKPPGFINFTLTPNFLWGMLGQILQEESAYGKGRWGEGKKVLVEFVSANPTGPLSVAHGRQAAVGDALANLLEHSGYQVKREYYLNDEGTQMDLLGKSILVRAREALGIPAELPEGGYKGAYLKEVGQRFLKTLSPEHVNALMACNDDAQLQAIAVRFGVEALTQTIREELEQFGVRFDRWFRQSALNRLGYLMRVLDRLKQNGTLYESDGAWWLKSTAFGDDKDRVVIRSDGRCTYIAADIAYHRWKFKRGFDLIVNLWGPDHHGYIARLKAAVEAMGYPAEALQIRIVQLCTLKRAGRPIPMSTREGQYVTLKEVMEEVGRDAARFFFLLRKLDAHLEFDLELAKKQSLENPVYYIQYAHARIANIFEMAQRQGFPFKIGRGDPTYLKTDEELTLLRLLRQFPSVIETCARTLEPFGMVAYLQGLAEKFHRFYDLHRVIGPNRELAAARMDLVAAVRIVLANGLTLLGVSAPTRM
jgi:arginyl-tRNA synthetase